MVFQIRGSARVPGPLGKNPGGMGEQLPGPLGRWLWDQQSTPSGQTSAVKAAKKTTMPPPTNDQVSKDVHVVTWPLYNPSKKVPALEDVQQSPFIANCPVAAILAALAFTRSMPQDILSETAATVLTDLSGLPQGTLSNPPPGTTISSSRFFTVKLTGGRFAGVDVPGGTVDVSDVLYTDDHDRGWSPLYMRDPNGQSIWASIIEKALAVQLKSYENFDAVDFKVNDFWEMITGVKPGGLTIKNDTPLTEITAAAKAATQVPSIGASKPDAKDVKFVTEFHAHTMMGLEGTKIKVYDPAKAKTILLAPTEFHHDFQAIYFRK